MESKHFLQDLAKRLSEALPPNLQSIKSDCEKTMHTVLNHTFSKLELVTRDEFDAQAKVLARTRQKVELLQTKIKELEKIIEESSK